MNKLFSYDINEEASMMRNNDYTEEELNLIISERYTRIIDNASSISFNADYYVPVDIETGEIITYKHRTECTVIIAYDSTYWYKIENSYYRLHKIDKRPLIVKNTKQEEKENTEIQKYVPPINHPWRKDMNKFFR